MGRAATASAASWRLQPGAGVVVSGALAGGGAAGRRQHGRQVLRRYHIAPATFVTVMAAHAQHGNDDTGRDCHPDVEHIQTVARCSERTVQRARAAARELGIAREIDEPAIPHHGPPEY